MGEQELEVSFKLPFATRFDEDAKVHIGFCPILKLYSQGDTVDEAEAAAVSAAALFIGACYERKILGKFMHDHGMSKIAPERQIALENADKPYIRVRPVPGYDRVVERDVPIHILAMQAQIGAPCH